MTKNQIDGPFRRLSAQEVGTSSEKGTIPLSERVRIAQSASRILVSHSPDLIEQPGRLAERIDEITSVGFEDAAFVALSGNER